MQQPTNPNSREKLLKNSYRLEIKSRRRQLALLVLDASDSMAPHVHALNDAVTALVKELANPKNRDAFDVAAVSFGSGASLLQNVAPATSVRVPPVQPNGMTNMSAGLEMADAILDSYLARPEITPERPVIVLMTDGQPNIGDPKNAAERIRSRAEILAVAFGPNADHGLLESLVSAPSYAVRTSDAASLRTFFQGVGATMSMTFGTGGLSFGAVAADMFASRRSKP